MARSYPISIALLRMHAAAQSSRNGGALVYRAGNGGVRAAPVLYATMPVRSRNKSGHTPASRATAGAAPASAWPPPRRLRRSEFCSLSK